MSEQLRQIQPMDCGCNGSKRNRWHERPESTDFGISRKNQSIYINLFLYQSIYINDPHMMAEWHIYASGPNKNPDGQKFWRGDGVPKGQTKVRKTISEAKNSRATQVY